MLAFALESFPLEQLPDPDALMQRLGQWAAGLSYPVRMLCLSQRFDMAPLMRDLTAQVKQRKPLVAVRRALVETLNTDGDLAAVLAGLDLPLLAMLLDGFGALPDLAAVLAGETVGTWEEWAAIVTHLNAWVWPTPHLEGMTRFYNQLQARHIRQVRHYLLCDAPAEVSPESIAASLRHATGRAARLVETLPALIACAYRATPTALRPTQAGQPWLALLDSYAFRGTWGVDHLHPLLNLPFDVAVAIDIQTLSRQQAQREADMAHWTATTNVQSTSIKDTRAERLYFDTQRVMHALTEQRLHFDTQRVMHALTEQRLHTVQVTVLVAGEDQPSLDAHVAEVQSVLGTSLQLRRTPGVQPELLKLFSLTPSRVIDAPLERWPVLSDGVGCFLGLIGYHRSSNITGLLYGLDLQRNAPLIYHLFADNQAAHMAVLGKTGFGKTVFLNVLMLRAAALAGWRVIAIDAFKNAQRICGAAPLGAHATPGASGAGDQHPRCGLRRPHRGRLAA